MANVEKISIALQADMVTLIRSAVETGDYASSREVVREDLREWKTCSSCSSSNDDQLSDGRAAQHSYRPSIDSRVVLCGVTGAPKIACPRTEDGKHQMTIATADLPPSEAAPEGSRLPDEYLSKFYAELRRLARARLAAGGNYTLLNTTDLVHESFLRLQHANPLAVNDSQHFLAYAAATMRSVIVDYVRHRKTARRGGGAEHVALHTDLEPADASDDEILDVHDALEVLATVDARLVKVVEMRYFGGLTDVDIGRALGVTERTVRRDWDRARLLLAGLLER